MKTVWKYTIRLTGPEGLDLAFEIPGGGQFLFAKERLYDDNRMAIHPDVIEFDTWWAVDPENVPVEVQLHIRGTGDEVPPSTNYLATVFHDQNRLVLHIWQKDVAFVDMQIVDGKFVPK